MDINSDKKNAHLTFESDNLAVPEVHTHEAPEDMTDCGQNSETEAEITFDNVAIPEIHLKGKRS